MLHYTVSLVNIILLVSILYQRLKQIKIFLKSRCICFHHTCCFVITIPVVCNPLIVKNTAMEMGMPWQHRHFNMNDHPITGYKVCCGWRVPLSLYAKDHLYISKRKRLGAFYQFFPSSLCHSSKILIHAPPPPHPARCVLVHIQEIYTVVTLCNQSIISPYKHP